MADSNLKKHNAVVRKPLSWAEKVALKIMQNKNSITARFSSENEVYRLHEHNEHPLPIGLLVSALQALEKREYLTRTTAEDGHWTFSLSPKGKKAKFALSA